MRFKSGAYFRYVSILNQIATQPLDARCNFATASTMPRTRLIPCADSIQAETIVATVGFRLVGLVRI